jgi:hypothetical protein
MAGATGLAKLAKLYEARKEAQCVAVVVTVISGAPPPYWH